MTDKQIIIDVNKCPFLDEWNHCTLCKEFAKIQDRHLLIETDLRCEEQPSELCYYKQLKRKEQECEELKKELDKEHLLMLEKQDKATRYFLVLNGIKEYIYNNTDFDVNDSIQSKTSGYDILQIIKDV